MECREVRLLAEEFVSEQLSVETMGGVAAHLERCPICRVEIQDLQRLRAATRTAFERASDLAVRPEFASALRERLQADAHHRHARMPRRRWLAIAASGLLAVAAGWGWREWSSSGLSALLHAAVGDHRFCALTFKLAERPIPLQEAARRYGGVYRLLETVEPSSAVLSGGPLRIVERHSCVFDGRRFAHIVLRYRDEAVSMLITEDMGAAEGADTDRSPSALPVTDGFHVASFRGPRHVVFIVSSLGTDDVQEVAQALAEPVSRALAGA